MCGGGVDVHMFTSNNTNCFRFLIVCLTSHVLAAVLNTQAISIAFILIRYISYKYTVLMYGANIVSPPIMFIY